MRVKITYTVELEEVESEVSEIMCRAASDLDFVYQEITKIQEDLDTKTGNLEKNVEKINSMRKKMFSADQILNDCETILEGLANVRKQLEEKKNEIQDG